MNHYAEVIVKSIRATLCILLAALIPGLSVIGNTLPAEKMDRVQTGMTTGGAILGLGIMGVVAFSLPPEGTSLASRLLVAIPVAGVAGATGALAGRWIADSALKLKTSLIFSPFVGAGLGMLSAAFVGGIGFALAFAVASPTVEAPPGYWGNFTYPQAVGMGFLAGAFWGGLSGLPIGAVAVPIISIYMGF